MFVLYKQSNNLLSFKPKIHLNVYKGVFATLHELVQYVYDYDW